MNLFPIPASADPLHIFLPTGPIPPAVMSGVLTAVLATQPLAADASPEEKADHRLATMHAIAAFRPEDAGEAMLAGLMVATNARVMRCLALAEAPDSTRADARRDGAQAAALLRCMLATLRVFQRIQVARRKDEAQPSERSGYWFRDVSVPAPEEAGAAVADSEQDDPMHRETAPAATSPASAARGNEPMHREPSPPAPSPGNAIPDGDNPLPDRMLTGDATMRFASRRLDPNQTTDAAWARAVADAAAEEAAART